MKLCRNIRWDRTVVIPAQAGIRAARSAFIDGRLRGGRDPRLRGGDMLFEAYRPICDGSACSAAMLSTARRVSRTIMVQPITRPETPSVPTIKPKAAAA